MPKVDKFKKKVNKKDNTRNSINQPQDDYTLDTTRFVKKVEKEREKGNVDYILVALIIALLGFGIVMVLSASAPISTTETGNSYSYAIKQIQFIAGGLVLMTIVSIIDYKFWGKVYKLAYVLSILALLSVMVPGLGMAESGAKRWIALGGFTFQPSELAKVGLIVFYAGYFADHKEKIKTIKWGIIFPIALFIIPAVILYKIQNHLSALIIIGATLYVMMLMAGSNAKLILAGTAISVAGAASYVTYLMKSGAVWSASFRIRRIISFLNPELDKNGTGWQMRQSLYAIGSGGILGVGLGNSKQKYKYMSEPHNDFIFAILAEELGFVGCLALISLYVLFIWRGILASWRCEDEFGANLAIGITTLVGVQAIMNIAVATSSMPVTGVSLPFISYGGTSVLILLFLMGILLNITKYGKKENKENPNEYRKGQEI